MNKYIFWWDSPCKGMVGVIKFFCENLSHESIAITGNLGKYRTSMGWEENGKKFGNHFIINKDENWQINTKNLLEKYSREYIHIFGGSTHGRCAHLVKYARKNKLKFFLMTEAPFNNKFGIKGFIKKLYIYFYLPLKTKPIANKTLKVFCLSGKKPTDLKKLQHLGYKSSKIVPYGYWTEDLFAESNKTINILKSKTINIICPGILKAYKGVDILIFAINLLVKKGYHNLYCYITGTGEQYNKLVGLTKKNNLENFIKFTGVLSEDDFSALQTKIDILVAPGYSEPWGIRINEAIQRGQVVISSGGLGASDLIVDSGGGLVFPSGNIKELANSIQYYLDDYNRIVDAQKANLFYKKNISCKVKAIELYGYLSNI